MSKFNRPAALRQPDAITHQGGAGFSRDPKDELFLLGVANMVGDGSFYESGADRDRRFLDLIHTVTKADEKWMQDFIGWLRDSANMRSASVVAAVEYVRAGGSGGRQVIASVCQRADEPAEVVGYWMNTYGRKAIMPQPIKRGVADAAARLYSERNALKYDGAGQAIRFGDVIDLVHPTPKAPWQSALFRYLLDRRHNREMPEGPPPILSSICADWRLNRLPEADRAAHIGEAIEAGWSWERVGGWLPGGWTAAAWEAVIPNMGLMALTRNLRNFDQAGLSDQAAHKVTGQFLDAGQVRRSRQFPIRFLTAWKAVASLRWGAALEAGLNLSLDNVPALPGRTLILVDVSSSMNEAATSRRTDSHADRAITPARWEVASVFAGAVAKRAEKFDMYLFGTDIKAHMDSFPPADSILRFAEAVRSHVGGGTRILSSLWQAWKPNTYDRVMIITDEQTGSEGHQFPQVADAIRVPLYVWNLAGYQTGVLPNGERNFHVFGGLTDAAFQVIPLIESRKAGVWPWQVTTD